MNDNRIRKSESPRISFYGPDVKPLLVELCAMLGKDQTTVIKEAIRQYHRAQREYTPAPDAHLDDAGE